ncbi:MAG: ABC transporter ATP-binding protein [Candidatus Krumholzibacteriota bacterium]
MEYALGMRDVEVGFRNFTLGPLDLDLKPGRVVGLVGPNGSGKTTTMKTIAGILDRDAGLIEVCDQPADPEKGVWKESVGYVPDKPIFYEWMNGTAFLDLVARFYPRWDSSFARELADRFHLDLEEKIKRHSAGNRVKLSLVAALAHRPGLALFDEPTAGLDPVVRTEVFDVLCEMMDNGNMTVFYSTHILDDLHRLADDLVFLERGRIILDVAKDDLIDSWRRLRFQYAGEVPEFSGAVRHTQQGRVHELITSAGEKTQAEVGALGAESIRASALTLEEIAVHVMKGDYHVPDA